jgi:RNA polymerase sigma-70 factor (ECF subfamily)
MEQTNSINVVKGEIGQSGNNFIAGLIIGTGKPAALNERFNRVSTNRFPEKTDMNLLLARLARNRDKEVFAQLFSHFAPRLKSMLMGTGTDPETAEEVAQEAMISVWRKCEMYDVSKASASTWIFTIARNLRIDRFRKEKRPEFDPNDPSLVPEAEPMADEQLSMNDRQAVVRAALKELPSEQREVVSLSFVESLSHQEIADRLNLPLGTVKSRLRLSFEKLRTSLRSQI